MGPDIGSILASLPPKPHRSRLDSYGPLIDELRARGWVYRHIARLLGEKCGIKVSASNVHRFVQLRARREAAAIGGRVQAGPTGARQLVTRIEQRIADLKVPPETAPAIGEGFEFDPNQPRRLRKSDERSG